MTIVTHSRVCGKLPTGKDMMVLLTDYALQIAHDLPDERVRRVFAKALCCIVTHRSPVIARMVSVSSTPSDEPEGPARQVRRFFANPQVTIRCLWKGLYQRTPSLVDAERPTVVPAVMDGVTLEKPYARTMPRSVHHQEAHGPEPQAEGRGEPQRWPQAGPRTDERLSRAGCRGLDPWSTHFDLWPCGLLRG